MQTWRNDTKLARAAVAFSLAAIPAAWVEITLTEGRNRQVRRMTAAVGHPTLRLIRVSIGSWSLDGLKPGEWNTRH